jgi:hypothetical protein
MYETMRELMLMFAPWLAGGLIGALVCSLYYSTKYEDMIQRYTYLCSKYRDLSSYQLKKFDDKVDALVEIKVNQKLRLDEAKRRYNEQN